MPRLFVAIDLPDPVKDELLALQRDDIPSARWPTRDGLHLTLHFIGDIPDAVANAYQKSLETVDVPAFDLTIGGVGQFPIDGRATIMWARVHNIPELRALYEAVGDALEEEGFNREQRRYQPHITLMRFRSPIRSGVGRTWIAEHQDFRIDPAKVTDFVLYESKLSSSGSVYTKRQVYALNTV